MSFQDLGVVVDIPVSVDLVFLFLQFFYFLLSDLTLDLAFFSLAFSLSLVSIVSDDFFYLDFLLLYDLLVFNVLVIFI